MKFIISLFLIISSSFLFLLYGEIDTANRNIAVLDFESEYFSKTITRTLTEKVIKILVQERKYCVVERNQIDKILTEQGFQETGCTQEACITKVGKLLNVNTIYIGNINKISDMIILHIKKIDVQTGKIIDVYETMCKNCELETFYNQNLPNIFEKSNIDTRKSIVRVFCTMSIPVYVDDAYVGKTKLIGKTNSGNSLYRLDISTLSYGLHIFSICNDAEITYNKEKTTLYNEKLINKVNRKDSNDIIASVLNSASAQFEDERCEKGKTKVTINPGEEIFITYENWSLSEKNRREYK